MGSGFEVESKVKTQISGFPCSVSRDHAEQHSHLSGGMCCCHEEVGDVAGPSLTAVAFSSFPLAIGNTVLATDGSQLLHHFQDEVLSARSAPEATTWISLRSGEQQREGNPPDLLGAKLMAW